MVVLVPTEQEGLTIFPTHRMAERVNGARGTPIEEPGDELPGVVLYRDGQYELLEGDGLDVEIVERIAPDGVTYTPRARRSGRGSRPRRRRSGVPAPADAASRTSGRSRAAAR